MVEKVHTARGQMETVRFIVNVRTPQIADGRRGQAEASREDHGSGGLGQQAHAGVQQHRAEGGVHRDREGGRADDLYRGRFHQHRPAARAVQQLGPDADALLQAGDRGGQSRRVRRIVEGLHRRETPGQVGDADEAGRLAVHSDGTQRPEGEGRR